MPQANARVSMCTVRESRLNHQTLSPSFAPQHGGVSSAPLHKPARQWPSVLNGPLARTLARWWHRLVQQL